MASDILTRRACLGALGALSAGCSGGGSNSQPSARPAAGEGWREEVFEPSALQPEGQHALVFAPPESDDWPILIALHGRGEAGRGLRAGAAGWRDDYDLDLVRARLAKGELTSADAKDLLEGPRLDAHKASLAKHSFAGLVLVCPYTPIPGTDSARSFGRFVSTDLLARVPPARPRSAVGIDGVSMGGRYALELGFELGATFGAVGALQPAIREGDADSFASRAAECKAKHGAQAIHLVTSEEDPFREPTIALSKALTARSIEHQLIVTLGPHDYLWNRGPGAVEMLMFHERALRGLPAP